METFFKMASNQWYEVTCKFSSRIEKKIEFPSYTSLYFLRLRRGARIPVMFGIRSECLV